MGVAVRRTAFRRYPAKVAAAARVRQIGHLCLKNMEREGVGHKCPIYAASLKLRFQTAFVLGFTRPQRNPVGRILVSDVSPQGENSRSVTPLPPHDALAAGRRIRESDLRCALSVKGRLKTLIQGFQTAFLLLRF
ncbi:hypothetical protein HMPREF9120_01951 [Neisseria sp. oral taxon 020 str. F0370]|nr:hypothetical protein HMPREF9120_01951 [Neisseria sp. oral taxon 020 str. F0370]